MVKNMGKIDKLIRILVAFIIGVLIITGNIAGSTAVVLGFFAVVFIATSVVGTCPLYIPFKISTKEKKQP
ncbi:MAG: DUF2892 domain-containing protein [Rectinemataceae bacterium]|nr:DUF2892 domain-containing protein [Rectinemataceae bacterium]